MKRILMLAALAAAGGLCACSDSDDENPAPEIELVGGDIDAVQIVTETMDVRIAVTSPTGIEEFTVAIVSEVLTAEVLEGIGLAANLNLTAPGAMSEVLQGLGFPVGEQVLNRTSVSFDISNFIPLLGLISQPGDEHRFVLSVQDANGERTVKTLTFRIPEA